MDVKDGHCWRCEGSLKDPPVVCSWCDVAVYCSSNCFQEDEKVHLFRECQMFGTKVCAHCQEKGRSFLVCTGCYSSWYCDQKCQRKHWKDGHKDACAEFQGKAHQAANNLRMLYRMASLHRCFNEMECDRGVETKALPFSLDLLKLQNNEHTLPNFKSEMKVLTLSENFLGCLMVSSFSLPQDVSQKLTFFHLGANIATSARDVLLLYIMITREELVRAASDMIPLLWFSLRLTTDMAEYLKSTLSKLIAMNFRQFTAKVGGKIVVKPEYYLKYKEIWKQWWNTPTCIESKDCVPLEKERKKELRKPNILMGIEEYREFLPELHIPSVDQWFTEGNFILPDQQNKEILTHYNPIFLDCVRQSVYSIPNIPMPSNVKFALRSDWLPFKVFDYNFIMGTFEDPPISAVELVYRFVTKSCRRLELLFDADQLHACLDTFTTSKFTKTLGEFYNGKKFDRIFVPSVITDTMGLSRIAEEYIALLNEENPCAVMITECDRWVSLTEDKKEMKSDHSVQLIDDIQFDSCKYATYLKEAYSFNIDPKTTELLCYLRADYLVHTQSKYSTPDLTKPLPKMSDVFERKNSLSLRDFRKKKNQVVPLMFKVASRSMNNLSGRNRFLEWQHNVM